MKRTATTPHRSATTPTINVIYFKITKIPMKRIILSLSLILCVMTIRAAVKVDRIDPANWFVGMKNTSLQLMVYGENIRQADVTTDYDGVIVTTGEPNTAILNIKGEEHCVSHMDYLKYPDKYVTSGKVAVIGGGNVAADCAFTAAKGGAEQVDMFVRRKLSDMRISKAEYLELIDEHINVSALCSPECVEKTPDGYTLTVHRNRFRDGKLEAVPETSFKIPGFALIIKAVGSFADEKVSHEKVIYAGDCKTGGSTLVEALASGKAAAEEMHQKLS